MDVKQRDENGVHYFELPLYLRRDDNAGDLGSAIEQYAKQHEGRPKVVVSMAKVRGYEGANAAKEVIGQLVIGFRAVSDKAGKFSVSIADQRLAGIVGSLGMTDILHVAGSDREAAQHVQELGVG